MIEYITRVLSAVLGGRKYRTDCNIGMRLTTRKDCSIKDRERIKTTAKEFAGSDFPTTQLFILPRSWNARLCRQKHVEADGSRRSSRGSGGGGSSGPARVGRPGAWPGRCGGGSRGQQRVSEGAGGAARGAAVAQEAGTTDTLLSWHSATYRHAGARGPQTHVTRQRARPGHRAAGHEPPQSAPGFLS